MRGFSDSLQDKSRIEAIHVDEDDVTLKGRQFFPLFLSFFTDTHPSLLSKQTPQVSYLIRGILK